MDSKKSVSDLRAELKVLREGHPDFKPVSKMRKSDISELLYKLKNHTMTTPSVAMEKKVAKVPMMAERGKIPPSKSKQSLDEEPKKTAHAKQKKMSEYTEVESDEAPKKSKAPAKIPATKEHKQKAEKAGKKESMKEKMAKIRALKK